MTPALFIAHGSPMLAVEEDPYARFLHTLGLEFPRPKAVVLFSAHWLSAVQRVSEVHQYDTIYDFAGFPDELCKIQYPASGERQISKIIEELFEQNGVVYAVEEKRGLDHGAWVVLRLLYPDADAPVVALSINPRLAPEEQYRIGKALRGLRENGVLLIGSGGTVHNLRALRWEDDASDEWAVQFDDWLGDRLKRWDLDELFHYERLAPHANLAVPHNGSEHIAPLFYAMGAADDVKRATLLHGSYRYGNLSQRVWRFG